MADFADEAQVITDTHLEIALRNTREQAPQLRPHGMCHNCQEPLTDTVYFCDTDCRDDWEWREKAKWRNGGSL